MGIFTQWKIQQNMTLLTLPSLQTKANFFFFCCRLEAYSQLLVAESACSTNNAKIPWWYFGAHCQNTWEFCKSGSVPVSCSTPKRKEKKNQIWSFYMPKTDLMALYIYIFLMLIYSTIILPNILPFSGSWHVICQCCDSRKIRNVYWTHPHIPSYTSKGVMPVMTQ